MKEKHRLAINISIILDKRRASKNDKYPVRLRVYNYFLNIQKLYPTEYVLSEIEFKNVWLKPKATKKYAEQRLNLRELELRAIAISKDILPFNLAKFESLLLGNIEQETTIQRDVNYYFQVKIKHHISRNAFSTVASYETALKSLLRFAGKSTLEFHEIDLDFLVRYENYCLKVRKNSLATIGINLRSLRAVFNEAGITGEAYPFGKKKYVIKSPGKVKKALDKEILKKLFEGTPENEHQAKAKAFWFFSYFCNGMNIKDIIELKNKDVQGNRIVFIRAKTENSTSTSRPIQVVLNDFTSEVIREYGTHSKDEHDFVFPVLSNDLSPEEQYHEKKKFIRSLHDGFRKYVKSVGIKIRISTIYARHSFSTHLIRKGVSIEAVGEALGHTNIKTTMHYFAGFEDESKKEVAKKLLDFE